MIITITSYKGGVGKTTTALHLTIIPPPPTRDGEEAREMLSGAGIPLLKNGIRRLIIFQRAALQGVPVYEVSDPKARIAWGDYVAVAKELIGNED